MDWTFETYLNSVRRAGEAPILSPLSAEISANCAALFGECLSPSPPRTPSAALPLPLLREPHPWHPTLRRLLSYLVVFFALELAVQRTGPGAVLVTAV